MARTARKMRRLPGSLHKVRFWPALVAGVALILLGMWFWLAVMRASVSQALLAELPQDSRIAGVVKLSAIDLDTIEQVSQSASIYPAGVESLVATLRDAAPAELFAKALGPEVAFADVHGHSLAVVTIRDQASFEELSGKVGARLGEPGISHAESAERGRVPFFSAKLAESDRTVFAYREDDLLFVATDPEPILDALAQRQGFDATTAFEDVSGRLPGGADAYVFLDGRLADRYPRLGFSLIGVAIRDEDEHLRLQAVSADPPEVNVSLPAASGGLLPAPEQATLGISGTSVLRYLQLLEAQRSERALPEVIKLQNGIASLNRRLGVDLETDYLAAADGRFTYARFADGKSQRWMTLLEFEGPEVARTKVESFEQLAREKLTVPVRREVVKVLPDGSRSREIESEKQERLKFGAVEVEDQPAKAVKLPELGRIVWQVRDRFLLVGDSERSVARLVRTIRKPTDTVDGEGQLAVRLDLSKAGTLTGGEDVIFSWILATRPAEGELTLGKESGVLSGFVTFAER
ncbi:MAG: hypothetical protein WD603_03725 [Patescibacteria group bacterium]